MRSIVFNAGLGFTGGKNMKSAAILLTFSVFSQAAFAGVLEVTPGAEHIYGYTSVPISTGGTVQVEGKEAVQVTTVGAGLRKSLFVIPVYIKELLVSDSAAWAEGHGSKEAAFATLQTIQTVVIRMNMLRNVDAGQIMGSYRKSLAPEDQKRKDVQEFLTAVAQGGDAEEGKTLVIVAQQSGGQEYVTWEDSAGKATTVKGEAGFIKAIESIWYGYGPEHDSDLSKLLKEVLSGKGVQG
jgi:hypothetical protein